MMPTDYVQLQLADLRAGTQLRCPIYDGRADRNQLLLAAGALLSKTQLELLKRRGVLQVLVHCTDIEHVTGLPLAGRSIVRATPVEIPRVHSRVTTQRAWSAPAWKHGPDSFLSELERPKTLLRNHGVLERFERTFESSLKSTRNIFAEFARDQKINPAVVSRVAEQHLDQVAEDLDLHVSLGIQPVTDDYPSRHSLQMSMLAVSIGTIMGLSREELLDLSSGCLLHDAGMMLVPSRILNSNGPLTTADRLEVLKHPLYIADALSSRNDVSHNAKATVYQIHERMNGSGYPRQRQHPQIHQFARIGAVADTYLAMISPRNGHDGMSAYDAVEKLLYATRIGLFDSAVTRALLHAVSLFPVGSVVTLSDGRAARVSRSNRDRFDRPVVEILSDDMGSDGEVVNLAEEPLLQVVGAGELVAV